MTALLKIEVDARGVATVTLDRPDRRNALNAELIEELTNVAARLDADTKVRVVVLRGSGAAFCAGGDLDWMKAQFAASRDQRIAQARALAHMFRALNAMGKPLIAAVHGVAMGGGVGLVSVADTAIATRDTTFALSETRLGLIPATIGPYVVARVGAGAARRVMLSGRSFDAQEALTLGLVGRVVDAAALDASIEEDVRNYLAASPGAIASAKAMLHRLGPDLSDTVIEDSIQRLADTWESADAQEGVAAFLEKRQPRWRRKD